MPTQSETDPELSALSPLAAQLASTIARVASDIALVIDKDGVISSVAEGQAVRAQGCGDWVGQRWIDTVSAATRPKIQSLLDEVSRQGVVSRRREVNHPAQGGEELPLTWAAIRLGVGGPVLAVGRDLRAVAAIQQRFVEAQQDLERHFWNRRQAESRYQLLFQAAHDGVLVLDARDLQVQDANEAAVALLGLPFNLIQGRRLSDSLPPLVRPALTELLSQARSSGRAGEIRVRGLGSAAPLGKPAPALDISATPFRADEQELLLVRMRRDEFAGADASLLARVSAFVESTPDAVVITDASGAVQMANPAFLRLSGSASTEAPVRGRKVSELLLAAEGAWARLMARVNRHGVLAGAELRVGSPDGRPQTVQVSAALMSEGEQTSLGWILRLVPTAPEPVQAAGAGGPGEDVLAGLFDQVGRVPLQDLMVQVAQRAERQLIANALLRTGGQIETAATALGLSVEALQQRMQVHDLAGPETGSPGVATAHPIN
ncbi:MAG: PAS domain-containing protein [Paucibacter sp.]|nr:PAS domain-containing protein [Roseateles sp.]